MGRPGELSHVRHLTCSSLLAQSRCAFELTQILHTYLPPPPPLQVWCLRWPWITGQPRQQLSHKGSPRLPKHTPSPSSIPPPPPFRSSARTLRLLDWTRTSMMFRTGTPPPPLHYFARCNVNPPPASSSSWTCLPSATRTCLHRDKSTCHCLAPLASPPW